MNEYKVSIESLNMALNIIEEYQKSRENKLILVSNDVFILTRIRILFKDFKEQLLKFEDRSERYKLLEAYKILSQISFDMLAKEVMGDN